MSRKQQPNERAVRNGWAWENQTAPLITAALVTIADELEQLAPYVGGGDNSAPRVSGGGRTVWVPEDEHGPGEHVPVTSVEAAVIRNHLVRDYREEIRDRLDGLIQGRESFERFLRQIVGANADKVAPSLCGDHDRAKSYDGRQLAWVPMSRNADNGWHDATCRDIAGPTGLCDRCRVRMNGWRERHGLPTIGVQRADVAA